MGLLDNIKGWFSKGTTTDVSFNQNLFNQYAKQFGVEPAISNTMITAVNAWNSCYQTSKTQLMKVVCREAAKLTLTDLKLTAELTGGSEDTTARLNRVLSKLVDKLSDTLEIGFALGGLVLKPGRGTINIVTPTNFIPIEFDSDGNLWSAIFIEQIIRSNAVFTKLEYHHFSDNAYVIDTKALRSRTQYELGFDCRLDEVFQWREISPHIEITGLEKPLFGYFRMPSFNNIDERSYSGISFCSAAMEFLHTFDEVFDEFKKDMATTRKVIFVNNNSLIDPNAAGIGQGGKRNNFMKNPIPNLVVGISGNSDAIKEFDPSCHVVDFRTALQMLLDWTAISCGFTTGYFSFDNTRNAVTATQIESEDQTTVSTISAVRNKLKTAIADVVDATYAMLQLYDNAKQASYEFSFYARDLSATPIADRDHTLSLVDKGYYPLSLYLQEYEGMSEQEAYSAMLKVSKDKQILESGSSGDTYNSGNSGENGEGGEQNTVITGDEPDKTE